MRNSILAIVTLCISLSTVVLAQSNHEEILPPAEKNVSTTEEKDQIFISVEQMPKFPGGQDAMFKYLGDHVVYPKSAKEAGMAGIVYVYFVIDKKGNVTDAEVKRGIKGSEVLNNEALKVVKEMPSWEPGYQNGKPASVQFIVPIKFIL